MSFVDFESFSETMRIGSTPRSNHDDKKIHLHHIFITFMNNFILRIYVLSSCQHSLLLLLILMLFEAGEVKLCGEGNQIK